MNPPLDALLSALPSLPRPLLSRLVARAIERLDEIDGEADLEADSDDCGHDEAEPDFRKRRRHRRNESGAGCAIADPGGGADDDAEPEHDLFPDYGGDQSRGPTGYGYEPKRSWSFAGNQLVSSAR